MAPSRSKLPKSCVQRVRNFVIPVKLRPDQYCTMMADIPRLGRRGLKKAIRIGNKEVAKYKKDDKVNYSVVSVVEGKCRANNVENVQEEVSGNRDPFNASKSLIVELEHDDIYKTDLFLSDSDLIEGENSENSLGLVLSASDDEVYDEQENDIICNLVEVPPLPLRRIRLLKSSKRREKFNYGYSKFESRHDTQNLDRFFICKPVKIKSRRGWRGELSIIENASISVNTSDIEIRGAMSEDEEAVNEAKGDNIICLAKNTNSNANICTPSQQKVQRVSIDDDQEVDKNKLCRITPKEQGKDVPSEVTQIVEDIVEAVVFTINLGKFGPNRNDKSPNNIDYVLCSVKEMYTDELVQLEKVCFADTKDDANVVMDTYISEQISCKPIFKLPISTVQMEPLCCTEPILQNLPTLGLTCTEDDWHTTMNEVISISPCLSKKPFINDSVKPSPIKVKIPKLPPIPLHDWMNELLLTPDFVELQSFLSTAKVPELDVEMDASLAPSSGDIRNEVSTVDMDTENNSISKHKFMGDSTDDSDSDVVLLSDDETELYVPPSPPPPTTFSSIADWQSNILAKTWQEWPNPSSALVVQLGLDTGLEDAIIRDWFRKRTGDELGKVWRELAES